MNTQPNTNAVETPTTEERLCWCGCGSPISPKAYYRPGHDSRHVGQVAREVASSTQWDVITSSLPTKALQLRAWQMAYRLHEQSQRHAAREIRRLKRSA